MNEKTIALLILLLASLVPAPATPGARAAAPASPQRETLETYGVIITNAYRQILERDPDPGGYQTFLNHLMRDGRTEGWLHDALRNSDEYRQIEQERRNARTQVRRRQRAEIRHALRGLLLATGLLVTITLALLAVWRRRLKTFGLLLALTAGLYICAQCLGDRHIRRTAREVRTVTEARTRLVWVQDRDRLTDFPARTDELYLMGYDSHDGQGERELLARQGNYLKPLFTPDGRQVLYSVIRENKTYILNWDGSDHRALTQGKALATWQDPHDNRIWIYIGRAPRDYRGFSFRQIIRLPLDEPTREELVWDQELIQLDNFQLSADGTRASVQCPWPDSGLADLSERRIQRTGHGCWVALAPDNSYIMWTFDGAHRNLMMVDTRNDQRWNINISRQPAIGGLEVYHPRWANHPRFMTVTGPYGTTGEGIGGGGPDVEVHIGKFTPDFRSIEAWVQVTDNPYANFYPDLWVEPGERSWATPSERSVPAVAEQDAWPQTHDRLEFVWKNRSAANELLDDEGQVLHRCQAEPRGLARYGRHLDMDVRQGIFLAGEPAHDLPGILTGAGAMSLEVLLTPVPEEGSARGAVLAMGEDPTTHYLALEQQNDRFILSLHARPVLAFPAASPTTTTHVVITITDAEMLAYLDGQPVAKEPSPAGLPTAPPPRQPLSLGGFADGSGNWSGYIEALALYSRALDRREIEQKHRVIEQELAQRAPPRNILIEARLLEEAPLPTPDSIAPYRRGLVANEYEVLRVLEGELDEDRILVAHWAILDGQTLDTARRTRGESYRMLIEPFHKRPDLEGERKTMGSEDFLLDIYFDTH